LNSVVMGGCMAAGLTALMILLFLGNWRLTLIILAAIPLSIVTAILLMGAGGQTLNTMTLGGFALAVGILVDNGTVVIENIERHVSLHPRLQDAIINGAGEVGIPTVLSTLCICIVFVPVFLLEGTAKYLFSPLSVSVIVSLLAIAAALTVASVVRLAVHARREEIEIMQLVGAPQTYVRGPFIMEGALHGGVGSFAALVVLAVVFFAVRGRFLLPLARALNLSSVQFLSPALGLALLGGGFLVGCLAGLVASRRV